MMSLTIVGFEEARSELEREKQRIGTEMTKTMQEIGFYVEGKVKESIAGQSDEPTSVDTGRFLNSVTSNVSSDVSTKAQQATIYTPLDYPFFLEHGTSNIAPRRHFQNTAAREQGKIKEMMQEGVKDALKQ